MNDYLTALAVDRRVAASTQNQALSAIQFLYVKVLEIKLPLADAVRAVRPQRLPAVLSAAAAGRGQHRRLAGAIAA